MITATASLAVRPHTAQSANQRLHRAALAQHLAQHHRNIADFEDVISKSVLI
jgi:hypothetical protein